MHCTASSPQFLPDLLELVFVLLLGCLWLSVLTQLDVVTPELIRYVVSFQTQQAAACREDTIIIIIIITIITFTIITIIIIIIITLHPTGEQNTSTGLQKSEHK